MKFSSPLHPAAIYLLLTALAAVLSWFGSIYGWEGVESVLSAEGMRWWLRSSVTGYLNSLVLGALVILSFGIGILVDTGLWRLFTDAMRQTRRPSRRELRGLLAAAVAAVMYLVAVLLLAFTPSGIVRSVTGSFTSSPLLAGMSFLLSLGISVVAIVYAYTVDSYSSHRDIIRGMAEGLSKFAPCLVTIFFISGLFSTLRFTGLAACAGISHLPMQLLYYLCCLLTLAEAGRNSH